MKTGITSFEAVDGVKEVSQDHYKAWQIVQDKGYETILDTFREKVER